MKKRINIVDLILGVVLVVLVTLLVVVSISKEKKNEASALQEEKVLQESIVEDNVYMNSSSGDETYNYISNANKLVKYKDIPIEFYMAVSDEVNKQLQAKGYKGEEVTIMSVMQKGLSYDITMTVKEEQFTVNYLTYTNEIKIEF
jgi:hypothetical protein